MPQQGLMSDSARPVQLARRGPGSLPSALQQIDEAAARRAIERYAINKKRSQGSYRLAGADLNADGKAEAIVLFEGEDWCAKTGCSLTVFSQGEYGFRPSFRTVRVRPPVVIGDNVSNGWRDLIVMTGGATAPIRQVQLRFATSGYPRNAMLEPDAAPNAEARGETLIAAPAPIGGDTPQGIVTSNR